MARVPLARVGPREQYASVLGLFDGAADGPPAAACGVTGEEVGVRELAPSVEFDFEFFDEAGRSVVTHLEGGAVAASTLEVAVDGRRATAAAMGCPDGVATGATLAPGLGGAVPTPTEDDWVRLPWIGGETPELLGRSTVA